MLNFDVKEMIYNHLKDDDDNDYDYDYNEEKLTGCLTAFGIYNRKIGYCDIEINKIIMNNIIYHNGKLIVKKDTKKLLKDYHKDKYNKFITDKFKVDYKKLIFDNELRTNKMKIIKKYTDKDLLKNYCIYDNELQYDDDIEDVLETCKWCSRCKKARYYDGYLHNNIKMGGKCCCEYCVITSTTITEKYIFHFKDKLIDYNNFFYNNNINDNWNDGYNIETNNDFDLNEKERIINVIHNHNISVILNNDKKYTKKVLLDEMSKYHKYFKIIVELYEESDIDTNTDSEEDIDEQHLDL